MTLDKFGRHLNKMVQVASNSESETLNTSRYMFYNHILTFQSNKILNNKYVISPDKTTYSFPLESGIIENVRINIETVFLNVNGKAHALGLPLKLDDEISFELKDKAKNSTNKMNQNLFAEIVVKCPIKFENNSVLSETAFRVEYESKKAGGKA
jgi:hypothetical protein